MKHEICDACETVRHCSQHGCIPLQPQVLKPCRSPYCECTPGQCSHPGCYDARSEPFAHPKQTTPNTAKPTKMDLQQILDQTPRLRAWANIGPVQHAELEQFAQLILNSQAQALTADGVLVEAGDPVWVLSSLRVPMPTTVRKLQAYTTYTLFGPVPVCESWSTREAAENYRKHNQ
jgi:hypothetical protein